MTFNIWRFTDGKPGHDSQSIGLCAAIERLRPCKRHDVAAVSTTNSITSLLTKRFTAGAALPDPDLIIGAGHHTHLPMLAARHARGGKIIVLMKPGLPFAFFDICMIPKHDRVPERDNIITTTGALNPIQFNNNKSLDLGLILLGGPSRHYDWNDHAIMSQVGEIVSSSPDIRWMVADSPRTPETMVESLRNQPYKNLDILDYSKTSTAELHKLIYNAAFIWVTKDSVTMVYEALSSGASVALIDLKARNDSKISSAVNSLIAEKKVGAFSDWQKNHELTASTVKFNEAERCAELLLKRKTLE